MSDDDFDPTCPHCGTDCADMDVLAGGERRYTSCQTRKPQNNQKATRSKETAIASQAEATAKFATIGDLLKFKKIAI